MGTPAQIIVECDDGKFRRITVNYDGYTVLAVLREHYTTQEKIEALMALGDLSTLGSEIGEKHDFEKFDPKSPMCRAYGRDRGETGVDAVVGDSILSVRARGVPYKAVWRKDGKGWLSS